MLYRSLILLVFLITSGSFLATAQPPDTSEGSSSAEQDRAGAWAHSVEYLPDPMHQSSVFVPLDSWTYVVLDRIAGAGIVNEAFVGIRPLTRMQFAALVEELGKTQLYDGNSELSSLAYGALLKEFGAEVEALRNRPKLSVELETLYTRVLGISGSTLNDGYHFGTTFINDYGRPYQEGFNSIIGFSLRTNGGPMAFYFRGEYQRSPANPGYPADVASLISNLDGTPIGSKYAASPVDRPRIMEAYAAFGLRNYQFTIGKQDLGWGQSVSGAMLMTNHAEPITMLRINNIKPVRLPVISKLLGPSRGDFFFGRLAGHRYPNGPWIHGQKISFKPTVNLELGFSRTVIFAGEGRPLTLRSFWRSFASVGNHLGTGPDSPDDVGDRRGGFDLRYRVPMLRNRATVYLEGFTDDDPSPLSAPGRSGWNVGVYLARLPGFEKMDLRIEGAFTDLPEPAQFGGKFFYWNGAYRDSHTNEGSLLGSWVGRQGHGASAKSTYWFTPRHRLELQFRRGVIDDGFIPNGGSLSDFTVSYQRMLHANLQMSSAVQYESWRVPVLTSIHQTNMSLAIGIEYRPSLRICCTGSSR